MPTNWTIAISLFFIGILVGYMISRFTNKTENQHKTLQKELEQSKHELEQYRQELVDHFSRSAELLDNMSKDHSKMCEYMAKTSSELMPNLPKQDNPFSHRMTTLEAVKKEQINDDEAMDHQPRDYANGATGLFNDQQESIKETEIPQPVSTAKAS